MKLEVKRLGLAAFMKVNGCSLLKFNNNVFHFESDKSINDWEIEYTNSCCSKHDSEVCELRKFYKR